LPGKKFCGRFFFVVGEPEGSGLQTIATGAFGSPPTVAFSGGRPASARRALIVFALPPPWTIT